jgi:hypothetical protein
MNFDVNIIVLLGQLLVSGILLWVALRKAPAERATLDATTAAQYAQAAKLKGEENANLQKEVEDLAHRLELVERKKYRIVMEFTIGDPPELGKVVIEPILPEIIQGTDRNTHLKQKGMIDSLPKRIGK